MMNNSEAVGANRDSKASRLRRWIAIAAIAAASLHNAALSWGKWGDLLIDCGMDLEDARMLLEPGHTLYVNPLYPYGPLIPHFNALLFKIFGVHLAVFWAAGLCAAALMTVVMYRTARLFIGRLGSASAAIAFLYCCAFAQLTPNGSFNFVFSYRSCAQYGALLAMSSVYFLIRHAKGQGKRKKEKGKSMRNAELAPLIFPFTFLLFPCSSPCVKIKFRAVFNDLLPLEVTPEEA
jgi:hypothetical protein